MGRKEGYTHYVILPNFNEDAAQAHELINTIPKDRLILLDKVIDGVSGTYGAVLENFKQNIYNAMETVLDNLSKYDTVRIISSPNSFLSSDMIKGFNLFCQQYAFERNLVTDLEETAISKGEVFVCLNDEDLVVLIEKIRNLNLEVGTDVGIISYNETPLKKYILNGITTVSTDYEQMGLAAAGMIIKNKMERVELSCRLKLRCSL